MRSAFINSFLSLSFAVFLGVACQVQETDRTSVPQNQAIDDSASSAYENGQLISVESGVELSLALPEEMIARKDAAGTNAETDNAILPLDSQDPKSQLEISCHANQVDKLLQAAKRIGPTVNGILEEFVGGKIVHSKKSFPVQCVHGRVKISLKNLNLAHKYRLSAEFLDHRKVAVYKGTTSIFSPAAVKNVKLTMSKIQRGDVGIDIIIEDGKVGEEKPDCVKDMVCPNNYQPVSCNVKTKNEQTGEVFALTIKGSNTCDARFKADKEACELSLKVESFECKKLEY